MIGLILGIGQGLIFAQTSKTNNLFHGNLIARGVAKKKIFTFGCAQLGLFIWFAVIIASIGVVIPLICALRFSQITFMLEYYWMGGPSFSVKYPIFLNWGLILGSIALIALSGLVIYSLFFFSQKREKYFIAIKQL